MTSIAAMEPLLPEDHEGKLSNLAADLIKKTSSLNAKLNPTLTESVGDLVRSMNCYYSNLIEGHNTRPIDIDRALHGDYSKEPEKRNLQLEAKAHIDVQLKIDRGEAPSSSPTPTFIKWVHEEFCQQLPPELLIVKNLKTGKEEKVIPGEYRKSHVQVGRHIPPDPNDIAALVERFSQFYGNATTPTIKRIIGIAASHHRLEWIHPFADGNGRVGRLFSHAFLRELGVGSSLWSISRGFARTVGDYKAALQAADEPRRGDLDGRGNLTQSGLEDFCTFFLNACVDQVTFMESLLEPSELQNRMRIWAEEETAANRLLKGSWPLLREALILGSFERGKADSITGYKERQARSVLQKLLDLGYLVSDSPRGDVRLGFPIKVVDRWFPRLYIGTVAG